MTHWQQILRENDPGAEGMDAEAAARMREQIMRARSAPSPAVWPMRFALAAFTCVVVMMSVFGTGRSTSVATEAATPVIGTQRRQIQFATPGGTRIIWEINPDFTLGDTLP